MGSFKAAELAFRLEFSDIGADLAANQDADMHYHLAIDCGYISATDAATCSTTRPNVVLEGEVRTRANLEMLKAVLKEILDELSHITPLDSPTS